MLEDEENDRREPANKQACVTFLGQKRWETGSGRKGGPAGPPGLN